MDLRIFRHEERPDWDYSSYDRRNNCTGTFCYYLEYVGWYDINIAMRLLGHYRLFKLCKAGALLNNSSLPPEFSYVLQYRQNNIVMNTWVMFVASAFPFSYS